MERRFFELRHGGDRKLSGVAVRYGDTAILPWGKERFEPSAFGDVGRVDAVLNAHHDRGRPLARTGGGGLTLTDSAEALEFAAELPETRDSDDVLTLVKTGVLRGASIEFTAKTERFESNVRVIGRAALSGIAIVDRPAYKDSEIAARMALQPRSAPQRRWWF